MFVWDVYVILANTSIPSASIQAQLPGKDCDNNIHTLNASAILFFVQFFNEEGDWELLLPVVCLVGELHKKGDCLFLTEDSAHIPSRFYFLMKVFLFCPVFFAIVTLRAFLPFVKIYF